MLGLGRGNPCWLNYCVLLKPMSFHISNFCICTQWLRLHVGPREESVGPAREEHVESPGVLLLLLWELWLVFPLAKIRCFRRPHLSRNHLFWRQIISFLPSQMLFSGQLLRWPNRPISHSPWEAWSLGFYGIPDTLKKYTMIRLRQSISFKIKGLLHGQDRGRHLLSLMGRCACFQTFISLWGDLWLLAFACEMGWGVS